MDIRSIMTSIDGSAESGLALAAAIALGQRFNAHVDVLHVASFPDLMVSALRAARERGGSAIAGGNNSLEVENRARAARAMFERQCADLTVIPWRQAGARGSEGPTFSWRQVIGHDGPELARLGRISDLIVVPLAAARGPSAAAVAFETALFDTGRLVYAASPGAAATGARTMAIAWDGSREAAASVGQALPFLRRAAKVCVFTVREAGCGADPLALTQYLARHAIAGAVETIEPQGRSVGNALLQAVDRHGIELLVMGAYGQGITEDCDYGGVTRTILRAAQTPLLLAH